MRHAGVVIQRHEALSRRYQPAPSHEWRVRRYLLGDQPSKPPFCTVWHLEAAAPTCQRQRSHKAVAVPVMEATLCPRLPVGNTTSSICQQLDVAKRCRTRGIKWHVSPRRSHCLTNTTRIAKRNKITSQRRRRRIETRLPHQRLNHSAMSTTSRLRGCGVVVALPARPNYRVGYPTYRVARRLRQLVIQPPTELRRER